MKKVFINLPYGTYAYVDSEVVIDAMNRLATAYEALCGEEIQVVNPYKFVQKKPSPKAMREWYLGQIKLLATADVVIFPDYYWDEISVMNQLAHELFNIRERLRLEMPVEFQNKLFGYLKTSEPCCAVNEPF